MKLSLANSLVAGAARLSKFLKYYAWFFTGKPNEIVDTEYLNYGWGTDNLAIENVQVATVDTNTIFRSLYDLELRDITVTDIIGTAVLLVSGFDITVTTSGELQYFKLSNGSEYWFQASNGLQVFDSKGITMDFIVILDVFPAAPTKVGSDWVFPATVGSGLVAKKQRVGTFSGTTYITFTNLLGKTITSYTGSSIPSKISDTRINVTAGYLGEITLSSGHKCVLNHGQGIYLYFVNSSGDVIIGTLNGAVLFTLWGSTANIEPFAHTKGATLYKIPYVNYLSDELVINGTFDTDTDWGKAGNWQIGGGVAFINNSTGPLLIGQNLPDKTTHLYEFTFDIINISSGGFQAYAQGTKGTAFNTVGTHTEIIQSAGIIFSVGIGCSSVGTTGSIDNVSIRRVDAIPVGVEGSILPICTDTSIAIEGFNRLGYFPSGSGALKGLPNTYTIPVDAELNASIPAGDYTADQLAALTPSENLEITQTATAITNLKVNV